MSEASRLITSRHCLATAEAAHHTGEQFLKDLSQIGAAEELDRLPILVSSFAQMYLPEAAVTRRSQRRGRKAKTA